MGTSLSLILWSACCASFLISACSDGDGGAIGLASPTALGDPMASGDPKFIVAVIFFLSQKSEMRALCMLLVAAFALGAMAEAKEPAPNAGGENIIDALKDIMGEQIAEPESADMGDLGESDDVDAEAPSHVVSSSPLHAFTGAAWFCMRVMA